MASNEELLKIIIQAQNLASAELTKLQGQLGGLTKETNRVEAAWASMKGGAIAIGVAIAALAGAYHVLISKNIELAEQMLKMSEKTGISVENLIGLKFAAEQSETSIESFSNGMKFFNKALSGTSEEGKGTSETLKLLGVSSLDSKEAFLQTVDALSQMGNVQERNTIIQELFGRQGLDLVGILSMQRGELEGLIKKGQEFNSMTTADAKAMDEFGDSIYTASEKIKGIGTSIATFAIPYLNQWISTFKGELPSVATELSMLENKIADINIILKGSGVIGTIMSWFLSPEERATLIKQLDELTAKYKELRSEIEKPVKPGYDPIASAEKQKQATDAFIKNKELELKTLDANLKYQDALNDAAYKKGNISLEQYIAARLKLYDDATKKIINIKQQEILMLEKVPGPESAEKIKALQAEIQTILFKSATKKVQIEADSVERTKKINEAAFDNWKQLQELKLQTLSSQMKLEAAQNQAAVDAGVMSESEAMARKQANLREYYTARLSYLSDQLSKEAELHGTETEEYGKIYTERENLQRELQGEIIESEQQISDTKIKEETVTLAKLTELTGDREALIIATRSQMDTLRESLSRALDTDIIDEWLYKISLLHTNSGVMMRNLTGAVFQAISELRDLLVTVPPDIAGMFNSVGQFVSAQTFVYAQQIADYVNYVKEKIQGLNELLMSYQEQLLQMQGDEVALVELWHMKELARLKEEFAGLENTTKYKEALKLLEELYEAKLKKAEEAMKKEDEMWKESAKKAGGGFNPGGYVYPSESAAGAVTAPSSPFDRLKLQLEAALTPAKEFFGMEFFTKPMVTELKKEITVDTLFELKSLDPEAVRKTCYDVIFPEWEKYLKLKGVEL